MRSTSSSGSRRRPASVSTRLITDDDLDIDWSQVPEQQIQREDVTPEDFGRIAAQTAKQVILQRIREAERAMMYDEYIDRVGEVVTGIVQQAGDRNNVLVDLGKVESLLPRSEQVDGERYEQGSRIKAVITEVRSGTKGPQVILSRRDPELIKTLFELEVPEIADGLVEIRGVAREPGYRSKIAVESHAQGVDPVGACVGPRGSRVRMVVSELRGEKIDIIPWNPEPARFVAKALSPGARSRGLPRRRREGGDRRRPRRPARARDRQGGHERPARRAADRLEGRHPVRARVRGGARPRPRSAAAATEPTSSPAAAPRSSRTASAARTPRCSGTRFCGVPAHQALAKVEAETGTFAAGLGAADRRREAEGEEGVEPEGEASPRSGHRAAPVPPPTIPIRRRRRASRSPSRPTGGAGRGARGGEPSLRRDAHPDPDLRGLRPQGAAGGARCASGAERGELVRGDGPRPVGLHLPPALLLRARRLPARLQPHAEAHGPGRSCALPALH